MASGITVDPDVINKIGILQLGETIDGGRVKKNRYLKVVIDKDAGKMVADEFAPKTEDQLDDYKKLTETLTDDKCCFIVIDLKMKKGDTVNDHIFFLSWVPDTANVKQRMVYASSKDALKKAAKIAMKEVQASDRSDLDFSNLEEAAKK